MQPKEQIKRMLDHDLHNALFKGVQNYTDQAVTLVLEKNGIAFEIQVLYGGHELYVNIVERA